MVHVMRAVKLVRNIAYYCFVERKDKCGVFARLRSKGDWEEIELQHTVLFT